MLWPAPSMSASSSWTCKPGRSKVKPGITGPWQVSGRSNLGFREMVQHDINYIQNWSLWLDILVLIKTIPAVLRGRGAR